MGGMLGTFFGGNPFGDVVNQAGAMVGSDTNRGSTLFGQSQGIGGQLQNFDENQLKDPQGMGATTLSQMMTQAGQGAAASNGAAARTAMDMGARTGNTASIPAAIGSAQKAGMTNLSGVQNNLAIQNQMQKQQQQQQGAQGLSSLFGSDLSGSQKFGDMANSALGTELSGKEQQYAAEQKGLSNTMNLAAGAIGGLPGAPGGAGDVLSNLFGGLS